MGIEYSTDLDSNRRRRRRFNRGRPVYETTDVFREADNSDDGETPQFKVIDVELNKRRNRWDHHTTKYDQKELIVRRGQEFKIDITLDSKFVKKEDVIKIQFATGNNPSLSKGTMFVVTPGEELDPEDASAVIDDIKDSGSGSVIHLNVKFPHYCCIGRYKMCIRLQNRDNAGDEMKFTTHRVDENIIVLFNAWCKDDTVYMEKDDDRDEYVMEENGILYRGTYRGAPKPIHWSIGQFEEECLDAALYVLDDLTAEARGNPAEVIRCLTHKLNSCTDGSGILTGNWSGKYDGGHSPTSWTGSIRILKEFMKTKQSVNFGQCWVFSGLFVTVGRALGLPTRSVTNYSSAHDHDASMTIDYHYDKHRNKMRGKNDSIWNFHVWNEVYSRRPDLDGENHRYDGWQACDSTPQEVSDGKYQCGPCPVVAIKEGEVHIGHDAKFVFGEVNGDRVHWLVDEMGDPTSILSVDENAVGKMISTKKVGSTGREDLTDDYKKLDGSKREDRVRQKTIQLSSRRELLEEYFNILTDVVMELTNSVDSNADAKFTMVMENKSNEKRTVFFKAQIFAVYCTGQEGDTVDSCKKWYKLKPNQKRTYDWQINGSEWLNKVDTDASIAVLATASVKETHQAYLKQKEFEYDKEELDVTVSKPAVKVMEEIEVTIKFKNPVDCSLTKAMFQVEGAGIIGTDEMNLGTIEKGETVTRTLKVKPKTAGKNREIIASFTSRQLTNIDGFVKFEVTADE